MNKGTAFLRQATCTLSVCLFGFALPLNGMAQTSSGQILQEVQQLEPPTTALPEVAPELFPEKIKPATPKPDQISFVVKRFDFSGNKLIKREQLESLVAAFLNTPITFDELRRVTDMISDFYRAKGWLVRVILPQQDITDGVVTINIIEAKLGGIRVNNLSKRVSNERVEAWIYGRIPLDSQLSLDELDRALLTLNDLPDVLVSGTLQSGVVTGETILSLTVTDKPLFNGQVAVDNFGDSNTGKVRASALVNVNGALGVGDQISLYGMYAEGTNYGRLSVTAPVGSSGLRLGVNGSAMSYRVLNNSFRSINANGDAFTGGLEASYPIIRSRPMNLIGILNWNFNSFRNWNNNVKVPENTYDTNVAQVGVTGNLIDSHLGGGLNAGSLIGSFGNIDKNTLTPYGPVTGVAGGFSKLRYAFNRNQAITESLSAYIAVSGQWASKNMDSSEQLYLGGPMNVRAYASGQGPASQGNLTTFELRLNLPHQTQLTAFYDIGNVQMWKFNTQNVGYNNYVLQGFGLSFGWTGPYGVNLKATWAQRTGPLSQSVTNYLNQNGGTSANRFWLTASVPF